ncbi:MAG: class I SAM-dependent methyltransferase, partial [Lentilitoribacter sp.]
MKVLSFMNWFKRSAKAPKHVAQTIKNYNTEEAPKPKQSFIKNYFDNKSGEQLRKTITPNWESTVGHVALLNIPDRAKNIVEIGCGIGRILKELHDQKPGRHCVGFDASNSMIAEGKEYVGKRNINLILCDGSGSDITFKKNYFDVAFSIVVFQHIPNTEAVHRYLSVMYDLLKAKG